MAKLSTVAELGFNAAVLLLLLLFLNVSILPLLSDTPQYPSIHCDPAKGPGSPTGCGAEYDAAQAAYQSALEGHERVVFWASVTIGTVLILIGALVMAMFPAARWGVLLGGAVQFGIGTAQYWEHLNQWIGALILGLGLGLLIMVGWKLTRKK